MFPDEVRAAHASCGQVNAAFLDFVARRPECLERAPFRVLDQKSDLIPCPLDSWPTFVEPAMLRRMEQVSVGVTRLVQLVPRRILDSDPRRLAEVYQLGGNGALLLAALLQNGAEDLALLARGDYIFASPGFQCLEVNFVSNLGGWETARWGDLYLGIPLIARFLEEKRVAVTGRDTLRIFFAHVTEQLLRSGQREVSLAFVLSRHQSGSAYLREYAGREMAAVLGEMGGTPGQLVVATYEDLQERGRRLWYGDRCINVVVQGGAGAISNAVLRCLMAGSIQIYNGPLARILTTKRTLALLSEHQESPLFTEEERALIRAHVPWTRRIGRHATRYRDEMIPLPDLLLRERQGFVLKQEGSAGGKGIHLGRYTDPESWRSLVETALNEGSWIVQEHVESLPFVNQRGDRGFAVQDVVWGLFAFGSRYGGCYLRALPRDAFGIVNSSQGAREGLALEVMEGSR